MKDDFRRGSESPFAFFDYAATTFMPTRVLNKLNDYYYNVCVSPHRGNNRLSICADTILHESREYIKDFFGGTQEQELIFYRGASYAINEIAYSLEHIIKPMNIILLGPFEHHSNYLPWRELSRRTGAIVFEMPLLDHDTINYDYLYEIREQVKIISYSSVANTNGFKMDTSKLLEIFHNDVIIIADDSQRCAHGKIESFDRVDCHILNAHKMYGPKGIAAALVSRRFFDLLKPCIYGGGMVERIGFPNVWKRSVEAFECGSLDVAGIYAWKEACAYIRSIGFENVEEHEKSDNLLVRNKLKKLSNVKIISSPDTYSLISFYHETIHAHDIESFFSDRNVIVRAGHLCSQNSIAKYGMRPIVRISFGIGIDNDDMDKLLNTIGECLG